ncbi:MAG: hypothetical protein ACP5IJ_00045 [Candidatus Nanoarchaeia archaeon]
MGGKTLRGVQSFNLMNEKEAKQYFSILKKIVKSKLKVPIMAKGMMRLIDFSKKLAKLDIYPPFETHWTKEEKLILGKFLSGQ